MNTPTYIAITPTSLAWMSKDSSSFMPLPVTDVQDYPRKKTIISRVRTLDLLGMLAPLPTENVAHAIIERPDTYLPQSRYVTTLRQLEAVITVLELLTIPYEFVDAKEWQHTMLPSGLKAGAPTRRASMDIGKRLFPQHIDTINSIGHADALLLAEFYRHASNINLREV